MAFEITPLSRDPESQIYVHAYDVEEGTMAAGNRLQVRLQVGGEITTLFDETVPAGKQWSDIHFQFQALETPV